MNLNHLVYYENSQEEPDRPQEDWYSNLENIFVVADGITHDRQNEVYPNPSDSAKVARIICDTAIETLKNSAKKIDDIKNAFISANRKVSEFNKERDFYKDRENNGYTIGAATAAIIVIEQGKLLYGVLDDCFFSIFSNNLVDRPTLKSHVEDSSKYFDNVYDWSKKEDRKIWRKDFRNNHVKANGKTYGYGAIDGSEGFMDFAQFGKEKLLDGDLICLYTDGFIKPIADSEFVKTIKDREFSEDMMDYISTYTKKSNYTKEKTCYFIKHTE